MSLGTANSGSTSGGGGLGRRGTTHLLPPEMSLARRRSSAALAGSDRGSPQPPLSRIASCLHIARTFKVSSLFHRVKQLKTKKRRRDSWDSIQDSEFDEMDGPHVHFRPEALETLCQLTAFSRKELQVMYRSFKQEAPSGVLREETFKHIFAQFFPGADSGQYAHYVWSTTLDPEKAGVVTFTDFVIGLSVLSRGSLQDKLRWTFSLYDVNGDGIITKDDLSRIVIAVYDLLGKAVDPAVDENTYREHIDKVFAKFDLNDDGIVTLDEFLTVCTQDKTIARSFDVFTTTNLL